jgi:hypothetical protein
MERLNIDTFGPFERDDNGNQYIIVIIDCFTRFVKLLLYQIQQLSMQHKFYYYNISVVMGVHINCCPTTAHNLKIQ